MYKTKLTIIPIYVYKCIEKYVFHFSIVSEYPFIHVSNKIRTLHFMGHHHHNYL